MNQQNKTNDWKADGHKWLNQGTTKLPRHGPTVGKSYFYLRTSEGTSKAFRKDVFQILGSGSKNLLHYLGDDNLSEPAPHGSNKKQTKLFFRTKPSVLNELGNKARAGQAPSKIYKEAVAETPPL